MGWFQKPPCTHPVISYVFEMSEVRHSYSSWTYVYTSFVTVDGYPVITREIISLSFFAVALIYYNIRIDCMSVAVWCTRARFTFFFKGKLYGFVSDNSDLLYNNIIRYYTLYPISSWINLKFYSRAPTDRDNIIGDKYCAYYVTTING